MAKVRLKCTVVYEFVEDRPDDMPMDEFVAVLSKAFSEDDQLLAETVDLGWAAPVSVVVEKQEDGR